MCKVCEVNTYVAFLTRLFIAGVCMLRIAEDKCFVHAESGSGQFPPAISIVNLFSVTVLAVPSMVITRKLQSATHKYDKHASIKMVFNESGNIEI